MEEFNRAFEKHFPLIFAIITSIAFGYFGINLFKIEAFEGTLNASISVSAVLVGFMSTMVAILISNNNSHTISKIREHNGIELLNSYFAAALISGFVLALGSTVGTMFIDMGGVLGKICSVLWICTSTFFAMSSLRVIVIMLAVLKRISNEIDCPNKNSIIVPDAKNAFLDNS